VEGAGSAVPEYLTMERVRPTFVEETDSVEGLSLTVTPEFHLYQWEDDPPAIEETDDYLSIERFYADVEAGPARVRVGRQAVNWGSAYIWNPTDVFQEVYLTDYWAEREGVNAVRVYVPMADEFRFTAVAATGDTVFHHNRYAVKASYNHWGADGSLIWMDDVARDRLVWGVDVKGTAVLGYWVEAAAFAPKNGKDDPYQQAVVGLDYSFPVLGTLYLAGQYYYDGSGEADPEDYDRLGAALGQRSTLGMHYANLLVILNLNSDLAVTVNQVANLDDSTWLLTPYVTLSQGNFRLTAGANLYGGPEGGEFKPRRGQEIIDLTPDLAYYFWGRWYF
jgi:hypothetical protein